MKNITITIFLLLVSGILMETRAGNLQVFHKNKVFYAPGYGTYVETYLMIPAFQLGFVRNDTGKYQATVEVVLLYKDSEGDISAYDKYLLHSNLVDDTTKLTFSLIDQKRYQLSNGIYKMEATIKDIHKPGKETTFNEPLIIDIDKDNVKLSDVELLDSYSLSDEETIYNKSGYKLIPYLLDFYPPSMSKISFYTEIYNTDRLEDGNGFLLTYSIKKHNSDDIIADMNRFKKYHKAPVNVLIGEFDISNLPTGNYDVVIEVRDVLNYLLAIKREFFQRYKVDAITDYSKLDLINVENTFVSNFSRDELEYNLRSIVPITVPNEQRYIRIIIKDKDMVRMQQFFLNFWNRRDPLNPEKAWQEYAGIVKLVEDNFSTQIEHGFETDRGRVYLQYGAPNDVESVPKSAGAKPYEIWQYYNLPNQQSKVKFVFYNPTLEVNHYELIHSTANGEIHDDRWQMKVFDTFKEANGGLNFDNQKVGDHFGSNVNNYYDQ